MCVLYSPLKPAVQPVAQLPRSVVRQLQAARMLAREGLELQAATAYRNAVPALRGVSALLKAAVTAWRVAFVTYGLAKDRLEWSGGDRTAMFERYEEFYQAASKLETWSRFEVIG